MAWLIDGLIRLLIILAVGFTVQGSIVDTQSTSGLVGLYLIIQFLLTWFYTTTFEAMSGTTPGKRLFGLWVVHDNATPVTWSGSLVRNFLRAADFLPFIYIVGFATMLIDGRFRRLGDLAAGTLVVYRNKQTNTQTFAHHTGKPPPDWLSREERIAIVDFAERSSMLSADRQKELAELLAPLIDDGEDKVDTLKSWAHWIIRGQEDAQPKSI